jgi:hypothetical protein
MIADNWPTTDATLTADLADYAGMKSRAIDRAISELYGENLPAEEGDIPEVAKHWIADRATIYLVPAGVEHYAATTKLSESKQGATVTKHDLVAMLNTLKRELEEACKRNKEAALDAVDAATAPEQVKDSPAVSTAGLLVDPTVNAYRRGF